MTVHLSTRGGILCRSTRRNPRVSTDLQFVTCSWCFHALERIATEEPGRIAEARYEAKVQEAIDAVGIRELYDGCGFDSASIRMVRNIIGSVAIYLHERDNERALAANTT